MATCYNIMCREEANSCYKNEDFLMYQEADNNLCIFSLLYFKICISITIDWLMMNDMDVTCCHFYVML